MSIVVVKNHKKSKKSKFYRLFFNKRTAFDEEFKNSIAIALKNWYNDIATQFNIFIHKYTYRA